ncbi:helix-turn-helix domain-containing protein [Streptomyces sp. 4F14]|uniref:helix-turn-helix domain-containing protein n=1 Tax=Streptomyces sp. 4F14 TaxID=3394380 RepID=UPI003A844FB4
MPAPRPHDPPAASRSSKLVRGLSLLTCFRPAERTLRLSQLARRTDLSLATAHRLVQELEQCRMLERSPGGDLSLGKDLLLLARNARGLCPRLQTASGPLVLDLHHSTGLDVVHSGYVNGRLTPIGRLTRVGEVTVITYDAHRGGARPALVTGAMHRPDEQPAKIPRVSTCGDATAVTAALNPPGTSLRGALTLVGRDHETVLAALPALDDAAVRLDSQTAALVLSAQVPEPPPCPSMLLRGLALLLVLRTGESAVPVSELARRAGLPRSTTHRLISVLADHGFLAEEDGGYLLGPGCTTSASSRSTALGCAVPLCPGNGNCAGRPAESPSCTWARRPRWTG